MVTLVQKSDRTFGILTLILLATGVAFFLSGAVFLLAGKSSLFWGTILRHFGLGLVGGGIAFLCVRRISIPLLIRIAPYIAIVTAIIAALVFIPGIRESHGGATRWISLGGFSLQPGEFLKIGALLFAAWWFNAYHTEAATIKYGLLPYLAILVVVGGILLPQPDTDSFLVIASGVTAVYLLAGASWKHITTVGIVAIVVAAFMLSTHSYLRDRVKTFINPAANPLGSSYHVRQALIAIGSGQSFGRGYGQGVHKYQYLPEPMGDTIYAVIGEELGFAGTSIVAVLFFSWYLRAVILSLQLTSFFARYLVFGIAHVVLIQAFLNILSNIGLFPFSGLPLPFMSQGGTSLFVLLTSIGFITSCMAQKSLLNTRVVRK